MLIELVIFFFCGLSSTPDSDPKFFDLPKDAVLSMKAEAIKRDESGEIKQRSWYKIWCSRGKVIVLLGPGELGDNPDRPGVFIETFDEESWRTHDVFNNTSTENHGPSKYREMMQFIGVMFSLRDFSYLDIPLDSSEQTTVGEVTMVPTYHESNCLRKRSYIVGNETVAEIEYSGSHVLNGVTVPKRYIETYHWGSLGNRFIQKEVIVSDLVLERNSKLPQIDELIKLESEQERIARIEKWVSRRYRNVPSSDLTFFVGGLVVGLLSALAAILTFRRMDIFTAANCVD